MFDKLWEKLGDGLADRGLVNTYGPAIVFFAGGMLAYTNRYGMEGLLNRWNSQTMVTQVAVAAVGIFLLAFIAHLIEDLQTWVIRLAEGYFPTFLDRLRIKRSERWRCKILQKQKALGLYDQPTTMAESIMKRRLDAEVAHLPADPDDAMPTLVGNILRAAEDYPKVRYGLSAVICWPRLYPLLPDAFRQSINMARARLNESARLVAWSLMFLVWLVWQWWPALSVVVGIIAYRGLLSAAGVYGDLLRSAFDLYRFDLYKALKWSPPDKPEDEEIIGEELTLYLFRGIAPRNVVFEHAEGDKKTNTQRSRRTHVG